MIWGCRAAEHSKKDSSDRKNDREGYKHEVIALSAVINPTSINGGKKRGRSIASPHDAAESSISLATEEISDEGPI